MTLEEIKAAVEAGKTVHWATERYRVVKHKFGFDIVCDNGSAIGLTWKDGKTMNGAPEEFFVAGESPPFVHAKVPLSVLWKACKKAVVAKGGDE